MSIISKPGCRIQVQLVARSAQGVDVPRPGVTVRATCNVRPLFIQEVDGSWPEQAAPTVIDAVTNGAGIALQTLPAYTDCDPQYADTQNTPLTWTLLIVDDGTTLAGHVTAAMVTASQSTPLSWRALRDTYGWSVPVTAGSVVTVLPSPPDQTGQLLYWLG